MALYDTLPVYKQTYELTLKIFQYTKDFPREYKYSLGQDMRRDCLQLLREIYRSNRARSKTDYLNAFLDDFELLRIEVRLCGDMRILSGSRQAELTKEMGSIGRQITGWRNKAGAA